MSSRPLTGYNRTTVATSFKTTGIILRRVNYSEADRIITFLTPERGKVSALARGARRVKSRLGGSLELFSIVELMLARGRNLEIVTGARLHTHFGNIVKDYEYLRRAFLFCEMTDKLTSANSAPETYDVLVESLRHLDEGYPPEVAELYFKLRLLDILGYKPDLSRCVASQVEITASKRYFFSSEHGGLIESEYARDETAAIGADHIKLWRLSFTQPLSKLVDIGGVEQAARESMGICNDFYDYLFGKRFRAAEI